MDKSLDKRLEVLEQARWGRLTPLERAYELIGRQVPAEQWPDTELDAYCVAECQHLDCLSDEQLEALIACPTEEGQQRLYAEFTGQPWPV